LSNCNRNGRLLDRGDRDDFGHRRRVARNTENLIDWWLRDDLNYGLLPLWLKVFETTQRETAWPQLCHLHQHREVHQGQANGALLGQVEAQQDIVVQFYRRCWSLTWGERDVVLPADGRREFHCLAGVGWAKRYGMPDERTGMGDTPAQVAAFRVERALLFGYAEAAHRVTVERVSTLTPTQLL
jgi:hypothetical protein